MSTTPSLGHVVQAVVSSIDEDSRKPATSIGLPALICTPAKKSRRESTSCVRCSRTRRSWLRLTLSTARAVCVSLVVATRSRLTSFCSAQVSDAVGEMPLRSPWVYRDVQRLPPSGLVTAHILLLQLPCFRVCSPDERVPSDGRLHVLYRASCT